MNSDNSTDRNLESKNIRVPDSADQKQSASKGVLSAFGALLGKAWDLMASLDFKDSIHRAELIREKILTPKVAAKLEYLGVLLPGLFFIAIGFSALLAPQMIVFLAAGFCISFGFLMCIGGAKLLDLKRKVSKFSHQIEARLIVDPGKSMQMSDLAGFDNKKEFFH